MYQLDTYFSQLGNKREPGTGAVTYPIHLSTAYRHSGLHESTGFDYTRTKNPTRETLEQGFQLIEKGAGCCAASSGMAAIQLVLSLFQSGDEIIVSEDLYGGTYRLFSDYEARFQVRFIYVDPLNIQAFRDAVTERTKAVFVESVTNPLLKKVDIEALGQMLTDKDILLIVDNTFLTPYVCQPLTLGADIVIHSATKYLAGHNDCLSGLVVAKSEELYQALFQNHNASGATLSPFDCYLLIRGLKTLPLRLDRQVTSAKIIAKHLRNHPSIHQVYYPETGAMISFEVTDCRAIDPFLRTLELISFAESLGGVESFVTYPLTQTHADMPKDVRKQRGITDRLLRLSVGTEHVDDLIKDLDKALSKASHVNE
jgi:cystathionine gamma-synthase